MICPKMQYSIIPTVKHLSVKHRESLNAESALFNGFFRLEKLSIFETLGKNLAKVESLPPLVSSVF